MKKAYLVLADGSVFEGEAFGAEGEAIGEAVFTTGAVGYGETLTNPCHAGQIVVQSFPLAGNYGVMEADYQGSCAAAGYVVREHCDTPSNFRSECSLDAYLKRQNIPAICGVDVRALTLKLRESGVMNAMLCHEIPADLSILQDYQYSGAVARFSCTEKTLYPADGSKYSVAMLDLGAKAALISELNKLGCSVTLYPFDTTAEEILSGKHDGLVLSDGGGNPHENGAIIAQIRAMLGKLPMLGVGLGHLLMAMAANGTVERMKFGHHGSNQPVKGSGRCYITSQCHLYAVTEAPEGEMLLENVNDHSLEGLNYPSMNAFSLQFVPESCVGPNDASFLYKRFISMIGGDESCR